MDDWSARQYLKFEDERTRPPRDLLAQVPLERARRVVDLGCGPGNSTELLIERYPHAAVIGIDSSSDMLRQARERLPACTFVKADIATWTPPKRQPTSCSPMRCSNGCRTIPRCCGGCSKRLPAGGVLAVQMPDNTREPAHLLACAKWRRLARGRTIPPCAPPSARPAAGRRIITICSRPLCTRIDIWHSVYNHVMASPQAIVEWFKGSALQPFLSPLDAAARENFSPPSREKIARAYQPRVDGKLLLRFPRLFIVAVR